MVGMGRVELPTYRLGGGCSIHLSYIPSYQPSLPVTHRAASGRMSTPGPDLPAPQSSMSDVFAIVHTVEVDLRSRSIGMVESGLQRIPSRRDA